MLPSALTLQEHLCLPSHGPVQDKPKNKNHPKFSALEGKAVGTPFLIGLLIGICVQYTQGFEVHPGESSFRAFLIRTW